MASNYAFPDFGDVKLSSGYCVPSEPFNAGDFYELNYDLMTGDTDTWTWYKGQIDAWASLGRNCVSIILSSFVLYGGRPHVTESQFQAGLAQVLDYCASIGMHVLVTLAQGYELDQVNSPTLPEFLTYLEDAAGWASAYNNVVGLVAIEEIDVPQDSLPLEWDNRDDIIAAAKAGRVRSTLPVGCTLGGYYPWDLTRIATLRASGAEFVGLNNFDSPLSASDVTTYAGAHNNTTLGPTIYTSCGIASGSHSGAQLAAFYAGLKAVLDHNRAQLATVWCIAHYDSTAKYGVFTAAFAPLTSATDVIETFPDEVGDYDGAEDDGAVVQSAPTVKLLGSRGYLSWPAPTGPGGTVTVTPHYIKRDANGFPDFASDSWHSGTGTTGQTGIITGLAPNQSYKFRLHVSS